MNPFSPTSAPMGEQRSWDGLERKHTANLSMWKLPLYCRKKAYINHIVMSMNSSIYRWFIWGFWLRIITLLKGKRRPRTIINVKAYLWACARIQFICFPIYEWLHLTQSITTVWLDFIWGMYARHGKMKNHRIDWQWICRQNLIFYFPYAAHRMCA